MNRLMNNIVFGRNYIWDNASEKQILSLRSKGWISFREKNEVKSEAAGGISYVVNSRLAP